MNITIRKLKKEDIRLYNLALREQAIGDWVKDSSRSIYDTPINLAFMWDSSTDGSEFWNEIYGRNYTLFYKKYGNK